MFYGSTTCTGSVCFMDPPPSLVLFGVFFANCHIFRILKKELTRKSSCVNARGILTPRREYSFCCPNGRGGYPLPGYRPPSRPETGVPPIWTWPGYHRQMDGQTRVKTLPVVLRTRAVKRTSSRNQSFHDTFRGFDSNLLQHNFLYFSSFNELPQNAMISDHYVIASSFYRTETQISVLSLVPAASEGNSNISYYSLASSMFARRTKIYAETTGCRFLFIQNRVTRRTF